MSKVKQVLSLAFIFLSLAAFSITASAITYKYDDLGRVIEVTYDSGQKITYTYDAGGNILTVQSTGSIMIDPIGNKSIDEGKQLQFIVSATGPQGSTLTYSASNLPQGAVFDPDTRTFSWLPDYKQAGTYQNVIFQVSDGSLTMTENVTITVNNVSLPPVLAHIEDKQVNEGEMLQFTISAEDPDNEILTYNLSNLPDGASFDAATQTFSWTPSYEQQGTYTDIIFEVADRTLIDTQSITITVNNINTLTGNNVEVTDQNTGISVLFDDIQTVGNTTVTVHDSLPEGTYSNVNLIPVYYDITTSAGFVGTAKIKIQYDITGFEGQEENMRLYQFKDGMVKDITSPVNPGTGGNPDTVAHTIEGVVDHFCYFGIGIANRAPQADAGVDQVIECTSADGTEVILDGTGTFDPDSDLVGLALPSTASDGRSIVSYSWTGPFETVTGTAYGEKPTVTLPLGTSTITLEVSDGILESTSTVSVTVQDTTAPVLIIPADIVTEATGKYTAVDTGLAKATDLFDVNISNNAPADYPLGITEVKWTAEDFNGNVSTGVQTITVVDTTPPVIKTPADVTVTATGEYTAVDLQEASVIDVVDGIVEVNNDAPQAYPLGTTIVTFTAKDLSGNILSASVNVTVIDETAPLVEISGASDGMDYTESVTALINIVDNESGVKEKVVTLDGSEYISGTKITAQGIHELSITAVDNAGNQTIKNIRFSVYKATELSVTTSMVEYSDSTVITASLKSKGFPVAGKEIVFSIDGTIAGTAITTENGTAEFTYTSAMKAGSYPITATFGQDDTNYLRESTGLSELTIIPEKAVLEYTGQQVILYPDAVTLFAKVNQETDVLSGDLSLTKVRFEVWLENVDGTSSIASTYIANSNSNGEASTVQNLGKGVYTIKASIEDDSYFTQSSDSATLVVYEPNKGHVIAAGWIDVNNAEAGNVGRANFVFNAKYKKGLPSCNVVFHYKNGGIIFESKKIDWLVIAENSAQLQGTGKILGQKGEYTFRVSCMDKGLLFKKDKVTITVWKGADTNTEPIYKAINQSLDGGVILIKAK